MNPLPQHKKSPEEIAKLRENLGIRPPPLEAGPAEDRPDPLPGAMEPLDDAPPHVHARLEVRSFKRSERSPQPQPQPAPAAAIPVLTGPPQPAAGAGAAARPPKPLRSLKKSEQAPLPAATPLPVAADSRLPAHRYSDEELAEARRRDALAVLSQRTYQLPAAAHPALLAVGYLLAIGGAAAPALFDGLSRLTGSYALGLACGSGYHVLTAGALAALPVAAYIHVTKSLSRHHAAFIAIIGFFALVFAVLHYFPQLRHAT